MPCACERECVRVCMLFCGRAAARPLLCPRTHVGVRGAARSEAAVLAADPEALVIRTNVVYGPEGNGKNFLYQLCRKLQAGESMNVPVDQVGTPTYNRDLALATKLLVEADAKGIFNVGGCKTAPPGPPKQWDSARGRCRAPRG